MFGTPPSPASRVPLALASLNTVPEIDPRTGATAATKCPSVPPAIDLPEVDFTTLFFSVTVYVPSSVKSHVPPGALIV